MFNCVSFPKEAVSADQFHLVPSKVDHGNTYEGFEESKYRIHGEMRVGDSNPFTQRPVPASAFPREREVKWRSLQ